MRWQHCLEIAVFSLIVLGIVVAVGVAGAAVVSGYRKTRALRQQVEMKVPAKAAENLTDEYKAQVATHWKAWRDKFAGYAADVNTLVNPLRRDTIDIIKESANWARLGIQYALIGNGGGLVALPYLLSQTAAHKLPLDDAVWSALWFALGIVAAAFVCLIAYIDFLVNASMNWLDIRTIDAAAAQRHFETTEPLPTEANLTMRNALLTTGIRTSLAGVALGVVAWFPLAWGALRIVVSLTP